MRILPVNHNFKIISNFSCHCEQSEAIRMGVGTSNVQDCHDSNEPHNNNIKDTYVVSLSSDTVCFKGMGAGGEMLKELTKYGVFDMYTGLRLIYPKYIEWLLKKSFFSKPLSEVIPVLEKQRDALSKTGNAIIDELKKVSQKDPDIKIDDALKILKPEHEKKLLKKQQPVFEELTEKACDLPDKVYNEFLELMKITQKRISREPVVIPFSAKELIYKLQRAREEIKSKNNRNEIKAINHLIRSANFIFESQIIPKNTLGRRRMNRAEKLKNQMEKSVLKSNSTKFKCLREIFDDSVLKKNRELRHIFKLTSAKIHGFPIVAPFKAKEFTLELKNILRPVKDRSLVSEMVRIAHKLPSSSENVSAFIVKYADDTPGKIGFSLLKDSRASIEHIKPRSLGGKDDLNNFGLSGEYINGKRTNIFFDEWCRLHPETKKYCQKYLDRMIELYHGGYFAKVGLPKQYLYDFVETIKQQSPKNNPIFLDLSKLER